MTGLINTFSTYFKLPVDQWLEFCHYSCIDKTPISFSCDLISLHNGFRGYTVYCQLTCRSLFKCQEAYGRMKWCQWQHFAPPPQRLRARSIIMSLVDLHFFALQEMSGSNCAKSHSTSPHPWAIYSC